MSGGWDFSCPQYVDFENLEETQNDNADEWFDIDHETGQRVSILLKKTSDTPEGFANGLDEFHEAVESKIQEDIRSKALNGLKTPVSESRRRSPRLKSVQKEKGLKRDKCDSDKRTPRARKSSVSDVQPVAKKLRSSNTPLSMKKAKRTSDKLPGTSSNSSSKKTKLKFNMLTMPRTPQVLKRALAKMDSLKSKAKSTEELELEMMKNYREKIRENHKQARRSVLEHVQQAKPKKVFHQTTVPKEFNFATDSRIKAHTMTTRQDSPKNFISSLRQQKANEASVGKPKVTRPMPFNFVVDPIDKKNTSHDKTKGEYKSMAEIVRDYHKQTPKRYHTNPKVSPMSQMTEKHNTRPHSPQLLTNTRKRKMAAISHEKKEEQEAEEIKNFKFKATSFNENLFKFPTGIKKINKPQATKPVPFSFEGDKIVRKKVSVAEPKFEFHAQPIPQSVLSGPSKCAPVTKLPITMPKSPAFALKTRLLNRSINMPVVKPDTPKPIRACRIPHQGVPFKPKLDKKVTVVEPFTFDERDKEMLVKKEEKIKEELEASSLVPKFKAQLLPPDTINGLPEKNPKPVTNPKPFKLAIDDRGEERAEKWKKEVEAELENQRRAKLFKAQPCTVPYTKPFIVKPSQRALTNISSFELNTDRRAGEREDLANFRKQKEQEVRSIYEERQKEAEQQQKLELAKLRKETVHKALPVMKYKPVLINGSDVELTKPISPRFSTRNRSQRM